MKNKVIKFLIFNSAIILLCNFLFSTRYLDLTNPSSALESTLYLFATAGVMALTIGGNHLILRRSHSIRLPLKRGKFKPQEYIRYFRGFFYKKELNSHLQILISQLERITPKKDSVQMVLDQHFDKSEMTYARFQNTLEQTLQLFADNVAGAAGTVLVFDEQEYRALRSNRLYLTEQSRASKQQLYNDQFSSLNRVITCNEEIITLLDKLLLELSGLGNNADPENMQILEDMKLLIHQTKLYK